MKIRDKLLERRKFIRVEVPIAVTYSVAATNKVYNTVIKNISADGLRFETYDKDLNQGEVTNLTLRLTENANPVHVKGRVIWKKKLSLEDAAPFDVGVEFVEVEDDNKNTYLKFLCDYLYSLPTQIKKEEASHAARKKK